jgi:transcriptional regulator with XRE-family HTH domain
LPPRITEGHKLLAHNVRRLRELLGIDTRTLATAAGWSTAVIEDIENAKRFDVTINDLEQLAEALQVRTPDLFRSLGVAPKRPLLKFPDAPRLLARNVWRIREQRQMTARALAEHLNWSLVEIDKIENGDKFDLSLDQLERISRALHVEPADLLKTSSAH